MRRVALERPDDVAAHLIYADALIEAGDSLGEVMQRQCLDPNAEAPYGLGRRLLGRLFPYVESWRIVRGFLREVRVRRVTPRNYRRATGRPEWEGVTSISFARSPASRTGRLPAREACELLVHPVCRLVREVLELDDETFRLLSDAERSFERVSVDILRWPTHLFNPLNFSIKGLELTCARRTVEAVNWLLTVGRPLLDRVETLVLENGGYAPLWLLSVGDTRLARLESGPISATRDELGWRVRMTPPRFTGAGAYGDVRELLRAIEGASPVLSALEIHMPDYGPEVLERVRLAARGVAFTLVLTGRAEQLVEPVQPSADDIPF